MAAVRFPSSSLFSFMILLWYAVWILSRCSTTEQILKFFLWKTLLLCQRSSVYLLILRLCLICLSNLLSGLLLHERQFCIEYRWEQDVWASDSMFLHRSPFCSVIHELSSLSLPLFPHFSLLFQMQWEDGCLQIRKWVLIRPKIVIGYHLSPGFRGNQQDRHRVSPVSRVQREPASLW